jgi:hypothetical protein
MKPELLASIDALRAQIVASMPDDPVAPTGLAVLNTYPVGGPLAIELGWDQLPAGMTAILEYKGADNNPAGPQGWTGIPSTPPNETGVRATLILQNPDGQNILFRLTAQRDADGVQSPPCDPVAFP